MHLRVKSLIAPLRRQLLLHAHSTDLWASYEPVVSWKLYPPALIGLLLGLKGRPLGVLPALPLAGATYFARQNRRRRQQVRRQILDAVSWQGDEQVLDVGCGSGMLLNGAAKRLTTGRAIGIDIWADHGGGGSYELLQRHARQEGVLDKIEFREVDARQMMFEDDSFDVVLSSWAIHHIVRGRDQFDRLVAELLRVLKPEGTIVVADTAHFIDVLADRFRRAGLTVETQSTPLGQKLVAARAR